MSAMVSQITGVSIVSSTVDSGADQRKYRSYASLVPYCKGDSPVTGEFPTQKASNAENIIIWWRRHGFVVCSAKTLQEMILSYCQLHHQRQMASGFEWLNKL